MKKNLPYPVWENNSLNYYYDTYDKDNNITREINKSLFESFSSLLNIGLYYPFNHKYNKKIRHDHAHSFEEVINILYLHPVSFNLNDEDIKYYNKNELLYIKYLQKYLLFIGRKDLDKITLKSCDNPLVDKLSKCSGYFTSNKKMCNLILQGKLKRIFSISYFNLNNNIAKRILRTNDGDIFGIVELTSTEYKKIDELNEYDLNYKLLGYNDINTFKKYIKENYDNDISICIEEIKVIEEFT